MGLWKAIVRRMRRKTNENRLALERYGLPWSGLTNEQRREIRKDVEQAFLEGDRKIAFSRGAEGVSHKPYRRGRAGQETMDEGGTERHIPPHASSSESESDHIPLQGKKSRR